MKLVLLQNGKYAVCCRSIILYCITDTYGETDLRKDMMDAIEIKGKVNTAICYAKMVEDDAIEQIRRMCDYSMTEGSKIRIMPDVHAGKGCTIGTTMTISDKVVPNVVGVDLGCGMLTVCLGKININYKKLDEAAHFIPSGHDVWGENGAVPDLIPFEERGEVFNITELACYKELKNVDRLNRSLGTLGGGNHFIEIDESGDGDKYLIIHTGSRNIGKQVAEIYQKKAIELARNRGDDTPDDLCYLYGDILKDYLHDVNICQNFALRNRVKIAEIIFNITGMKGGDSFHTIHNYIDTKEMILRKGAIAAHRGEKVLIPINMRDGSVLAIGKGNPEWNYSAPHGAGRVMSRKKAKENLSLSDYKKAMEGVYTTSVNAETLDEAPMAYKSMEDIIDVISESVDIVDILKPIYNFKSSE